MRLVPARLKPSRFDLHTDPYGRADVTSNICYDWLIEHTYIIYGVQALTAEYLQTFKESPPAQRPASFPFDQAMEKLE